jgi:hypothetical protein
MVDTRTRLERGRSHNQAAPSRGAGSRYEVWTPSATAAVRGTDFRVSMAPEEDTGRAEVLRGGVAVQAAGRQRVVPTGFGTLAKTGKPPAPPVPLLPAPDLSGLPPELGRVPIQIALPPLAEAAAYRLQVSADERFSTLLFDGVSPTSPLRGPSLPDGEYVLRVRGMDARGLEGRDAQRRFTLNARPEPPVLLQPSAESTVRTATPVFQWAAPENASGYHVQVAASQDFSAPVLDVPKRTESSVAADQPLPAGQYYWRVATRDRSGELGPFGDPQGFLLRPAPSSPRAESPAVEKDTLTLRWSAGEPGQQYRIQLASDRDFDNTIADSRVSVPELTIPRPVSGTYYLRMRTIDSDGYAGPYGPAQRIQVPPKSYWPLGVLGLIVLVLAL